jgi:putative peptidoglycan lipid II flippase
MLAAFEVITEGDPPEGLKFHASVSRLWAAVNRDRVSWRDRALASHAGDREWHVGTVVAGSPDPGRASAPGGGIARGAAVIASLTILSRLLGLVRTLVFSQTVGVSCLGTAYVTANQIPNLLYELILGGALTSAMVPVLARSAERAASDPAEKARVGEITSALLTWSVIILVPLVLVIAAAAGPIASLLNPANANAHCVRADVVAATSSMLVVFAPQALLYGLSVVLYGLLQSYRRFAALTIGPGISSLVLISCYLAFVPLNRGLPLARLPREAELVLSAGTTLGIAVLVVVAVPSTWRLHLRLRPVLRFPPGVARRAGGLALVGVFELIAVDLASIVTIALANGRGDTGAIVIFNYATQVFSSVSGILALSIVVSAFPVLAAREGPEFDRTCAGATRAALLMAWLGAAMIAAIAGPAAHVLARQPDQVPELIQAFALFAPGLVGTAVIANLSRVMFVIGRLKIAAAALAGSWLLVVVADVVLAELAPPRLVVAALALGNTIGPAVVAVPLVRLTRRICGQAAVQGVSHAALAGLAAGVAGAAVGVAISMAVPVHHKLEAFAAAMPAAGGAVIAFGIVAYLLDDGDLRAVLAWVRRIVRS